MRPRLLQPLATLGVASALLSVALAVEDAKESAVETKTTTVEVKKADAPKAAATPTGTTTTTTVAPAQRKIVIPKDFIAAPVQKQAVAPAKAAREEVVKVRAAHLQARNVTAAQRFEQQFRGKLRGDYQLLVSVCGPTKDQRRAIARAGEKALSDAAARVAQAQQNPGRVVVRNGVVQQDFAAMPDPYKIMSDALINAAKAQLPADAVARYENEMASRAESQREAILGDLTARLDRALLLSRDQRGKIFAALKADDAEKSHMWSLVRVNIEGYFPQLPDPCVVPFLSPAQAKVWRATPKIALGYNWGSFTPNPIPLEDAELDGAGQAKKD